ncbi:baseplate assembly protein, putative [Syntrophobotulus glycolicus DSM 8271]|uniref:Baseplate assembly protein, putative n=1 Tax=Syntrophobotulus glycolicus (strain DSM 8271 / FlGlyR) TaxID=645991 RepID=F0SWP2_SYNGF|nr:hypothetical protein [Syntrophobotulus glycolicus]ADY54919.1 baseplate assembly protein, putative [Syntrophobotulus glycolicus DSM 8271]ADY56882.1 baseplate assembly protein, putative [Syntrophobotulus glycolicus DSM 8271]ADY57219.1 baseplate assembly protein, putative [Syntrophobotulus glycolicus DSM 8271]ADY57391.1 baseplate assembly protein, putative [Syntrophobotulus glycolicus DSM 8271]
MAGLNDTDIKLDPSWQLTQAATGDAPLVSGFDCIMQDIRLEAMTQAGELFYDTEWGWSLLDFVQSEDDELTIIEVGERIREKLERREIVDSETISTEVKLEDDALKVFTTFCFIGDSQTYSVSVTVDRVNVEVIEID